MTDIDYKRLIIEVAKTLSNGREPIVDFDNAKMVESDLNNDDISDRVLALDGAVEVIKAFREEVRQELIDELRFE
jgi:hypothetical protein